MTDTRNTDRSAIAAMLAEMYRAWADNDADGFVKYYNEDATAVLPGSLRGSRQVTRNTTAPGFDGPLKGSSTVDHPGAQRGRARHPPLDHQLPAPR